MLTNPFRKFFHFCSGAIPEILKLRECSTEQIKYSCIGATVFFTAIMASMTGGYALYKVFGDQTIIIPSLFGNDSISIPLYLIFGIFWGMAVIFNLDRYIVQSIRKKDDLQDQLLNAMPRICFAVFISLTITIPLELKIFEPEIQYQLAEENKKVQEDAEKSQETATIANNITNLENRNIALNLEIKNKETQRDNADQVAQQESDGRGSPDKGIGPIYMIKKADASKIQGELHILRNKNNNLIEANNTEIEDLNKKRNDRVNEVVEAKRKADGLLGSLMALGKISQNNTTAYWTAWGLFLFFLVVETAPVFSKLVSKRGTYDAILERLEEKVFIEEREKIDYIRNNAKQDTEHKLSLATEARKIALENFQNTTKQAQSSPEFMTAQAEAQSNFVAKMVERLSINLEDSFSEDYFRTSFSPETQQTNMNTKNLINEEIIKHHKIRERVSNFIKNAKKTLSNAINFGRNN